MVAAFAAFRTDEFRRRWEAVEWSRLRPLELARLFFSDSSPNCKIFFSINAIFLIFQCKLKKNIKKFDKFSFLLSILKSFKIF